MIQVYIFGWDTDKDNKDHFKDWERDHQLRVVSTIMDTKANELFSKKRPDVIVSLGPDYKSFTVLRKLPLYIRKRWIHLSKKEDITAAAVVRVYQKCLESNLGPEISVFTSTYHSGHRILRPLQSLLDQTYREWEWVILDDSDVERDDQNKTWISIKEMTKKDCRIRVFQPSQNDGNIGSVKRNVASMCRGKYLVELDHDDELVPTALADLCLAFENYPDIGMIGSDCIEMYEDTLLTHEYGNYFGLGYGCYVRQRFQNKWISVARLGPLNRYTLRHIVGVANHVRAWRADIYYRVGGHDPNLNVADDYDLILRTFLGNGHSNGNGGTRIGRIPRFLYTQYRNKDGNNFTFHRNQLIQKTVGMLVDKYDERIHEKLGTLGVPDFEKDVVKNKWQKDWKFPPNSWTFWQHEPSADLILEPSPNTISIVMPTFHRPEALKEAVKSVLQQTHTDWILYIIGDACPDLEGIMTGDTMMWDPRIRYWNLPENTKEGGTTPRNYALKMLVTTDYVAYLDDDNSWKPNHLETLWSKMMENPSQQFVFSSFQSGEYIIKCKEPIRFRIDTSAILHKRTLLEKYGYWRTQTEVGYAHDFELVSRWKDEVWGATLLPTLVYNNVHQNMKSVYEAYPDQQD